MNEQVVITVTGSIKRVNRTISLSIEHDEFLRKNRGEASKLIGLLIDRFIQEMKAKETPNG